MHDTKRKPSVISISWGAAENAWTAQAMQAMDQAFADAALLGVSILAASGDDGSDDRVGDGHAHADFPASSPHVTGCGGTRIVLSAGTISQERTWNDGAGGGATGGGVSDVFGLPAFQAVAKVPTSVNPGHHAGRGVPDVAGNASPASGYVVRVDGQNLLIGGTSAVAPLYAGLIALLNQKLGTPIGFVNPLLYGKHAAGSHPRYHRGQQRRLCGCRGLGCLHRPWPDHRHSVARFARQTMNVRPIDHLATGTPRMGQRWGHRGRAAGRSLSPRTAVTTPPRSPGSWISPA